jgi:hypothetical protein
MSLYDKFFRHVAPTADAVGIAGAVIFVANDMDVEALIAGSAVLVVVGIQLTLGAIASASYWAGGIVHNLGIGLGIVLATLGIAAMSGILGAVRFGPSNDPSPLPDSTQITITEPPGGTISHCRAIIEGEADLVPGYGVWVAERYAQSDELWWRSTKPDRGRGERAWVISEPATIGTEDPRSLGSPHEFFAVYLSEEDSVFFEGLNGPTATFPPRINFDKQPQMEARQADIENCN